MQIIHPEDKSRLEEIHNKLFQFFYSVPMKERKDLKFAFNLRVKDKMENTFIFFRKQYFWILRLMVIRFAILARVQTFLLTKKTTT